MSDSPATGNAATAADVEPADGADVAVDVTMKDATAADSEEAAPPKPDDTDGMFACD